jgi:hypothetical protein
MLSDFLSNVAKHRRPQRDDPETLRLWAGIAVFDTEADARRQAHRIPAIGSFIVAVRIPGHGTVHYEQTGNDPHHYTLWAAPSYLLECVTAVVPV